MNVRLTHKDAQLPKRANPTDAGADLFSPVDVTIPARSRAFIDIGIQLELPRGTAGFIYARSGLGTRQGLIPRNCVGVIDEAYRGNIGIMLENTGDQTVIINKGDRVAQLVVTKVEHPAFKFADTLTETDRGEDGFGSTGVK